MIVRSFLLWARNAPPGHRAEAVAALANAYLYSDLSPEDRWEADTALTAMLDDPSALVRRAIAESLATSPDAPRHVILALAADGDEVAEPVLARSPLLLDCDLVDCAALGSARAQVAIARRSPLSAAVAGALGEIGGAAALLALARNPDAAIAHGTLGRMIERHGGEAALREALLARPDLPADIAQAIAAALARSLQDFVSGCGWLSPERSGRVAREAEERTAITLSARAERGAVARLVTYLRRTGRLTSALLLRAILSGETAFVEATFADLSGLPETRVAACLADRRGQSFRALYGRAGLPAPLRLAFEEAVKAMRDMPADGTRLSRRLILRAIETCGRLPEEGAGRLVALLRRFDMEAARDDARLVADELADEAALAIVRRHAPEALVDIDHEALAA